MTLNLFFLGIGVFSLSAALNAQYLGDQQIGIAGLEAATMPAVGIYVTIPLYYRESNISLYDPNGNEALKNLTADINLLVLPGVEWVTRYKILGAAYGAAYTEWISNGIVNLAGVNFHRSTSYGFGDLYVQPVILGWHKAHYDVTAGYAFFAPTGAGSAGFHQWVNEIDLGGTLYSPGKKWNASTMMYYDFNEKRNNADVRVGQILSLAGGIGRSFLKGAANAGVAYGAQWKITHDSGSDIPAYLQVVNGRVFGVGPELDMPVFAKGSNAGIVSFRYLWAVGAKTQLGGQILAVSFTFAHLAPTP